MIFDIFSARGHSARNNNGATKQKMLYFSDDEMDCTPAQQDRKPVRFRRRHPDRSDRRRSANADILESVGLPPTWSYNDMKSLQDGLCIDDILGRRSSCSVRFKEAVSAVGGNATQAARRASRWSKKMTGSKLQKKALRQSFQSSTFHDEKSLPRPQQMGKRSILFSFCHSVIPWNKKY